MGFTAGVAFAAAIFAARNNALLFVRGVIGGAAMLLGRGLALEGCESLVRLVVSVGALEVALMFPVMEVVRERLGRGPEIEAREVGAGRVLGAGDLRPAEEAGRVARTGRALPGTSMELREGVRLGPEEFVRTEKKESMFSVYVA